MSKMNEVEFIQLIIDIAPAAITIGLSILSVVLGKKYKKFKRLFIEIFHVFEAISTAIEDDTVTKEEIYVILDNIKKLHNELQSDD